MLFFDVIYVNRLSLTIVSKCFSCERWGNQIGFLVEGKNLQNVFETYSLVRCDAPVLIV